MTPAFFNSKTDITIPVDATHFVSQSKSVQSTSAPPLKKRSFLFWMCHKLLIFLFLAMMSVGLSPAAEPATELTLPAALVRCHSFENAEVARDSGAWPLVFMKPGVGALALDYTTLCEDLAGHGYLERLPSKYLNSPLGLGAIDDATCAY